MKVKRLLKFYFCADGLNGALDNIILSFAMRSADGEAPCEVYAGKIAKVISEKEELGELYAYLNGALSSLGGRDISTLERYALARRGIPEEERREVKRAVTKFSRRIKSGIWRFESSVKLVNEYYGLLMRY